MSSRYMDLPINSTLSINIDDDNSIANSSQGRHVFPSISSVRTPPQSEWVFVQREKGRPRTSDENVARKQQAFVRSPGKSTRRASRELQLPQTTVWRFLRKKLFLQLIRSKESEAEESFVSKIVFSDKATFHVNGKDNRHNVRIWGTGKQLSMSVIRVR
ncbi:hypothetical protein J6590_094208 [Homalodisca vitripennis]|nr:hypothetical protein J6590_094208 [Homalodisca vitripennis]